MNDITALMATMKAAAESVIKNYDCEWFETGCQICTVHKSKINLISLANPANVLALVEALEAKQPHHNGMMQLSNELVMAKQRIAELESRTVTVKLPELPVLGSNAEWYQGYAAGTSSMRKDCATALRAAGIQVIEGEG